MGKLTKRKQGVIGQTNDFICDTLEETSELIGSTLRTARKTMQLAEVSIDIELEEKKHELELKRTYYSKQLNSMEEKTVKQIEEELDEF